MKFNVTNLTNAIRDLMTAKQTLENVRDTFDASDGLHQAVQDVLWHLESVIFRSINELIN